jgi:choline dehydrogenase-like flavoprotein
MTPTYDFIIIGTGAGGSTLAHSLAPTGKQILILERGEFLVRSKDNWDPEKVFRQEIYHTQEKWLTKEGAEFRPPGTGLSGRGKYEGLWGGPPEAAKKRFRRYHL